MEKLIECVPNYSEGRDRSVIDAIAGAIASVEGVRVLHVDPGQAANRTVITFVGAPEAVVEAAFRGSAMAQERIDMRRHHGEHPRIGATDVRPLVPVSGVSLEECATLARGLAKRMYEELGIPCYCYEAAAFAPERRNLRFVPLNPPLSTGLSVVWKKQQSFSPAAQAFLEEIQARFAAPSEQLSSHTFNA